MEPLIERIKNLLATKDVTAEAEGDDELMFLARTGPLSVRMRITVRDEAVVVVAHIPLFVPAHRRPAMSEAIAVANWQLRLARFEMDGSDGELRCRTDLPLYDGVPGDEQLMKGLVYPVWSNTERYASAFVEVMSTDIDPRAAIEKIESKTVLPQPQSARNYTVN